MITKYQKVDHEQIINLGITLNPKFKELFKIEDLPNNENIYVYKEDDKVLGFLHILNNIDMIEILNLVVDENRRHEGVASLLLDYLLGETLNKKIILEVSENNDAAIKLYGKFNFEIINKREGYYDGENAFVMERNNN